MQNRMVELAFIGNIGLSELLIILAIVLLLFGANRLPQLGGSIAKAIRNFRSEMRGESSSKPDAKSDSRNDQKPS